VSIALMTRAWALDISPTDKLVLLALADWANEDGACWPSIKRLCLKSGIKERALQMAIKRLCDEGHLSRTENSGKGVNYIVHPRIKCTPADIAPPHETTPTPALNAPNTSEIHQREKEKRAKPVSPFDAFWSIYPKRVGKLAAQRAFEKAAKRDGDRVLAGAHRFAEHLAEHPPDDPQFIPHPATWLNRGSYDDELSAPARTGRPMGGHRRDSGQGPPAPSGRTGAVLKLLAEVRAQAADQSRDYGNAG